MQYLSQPPVLLGHHSENKDSTSYNSLPSLLSSAGQGVVHVDIHSNWNWYLTMGKSPSGVSQDEQSGSSAISSPEVKVLSEAHISTSVDLLFFVQMAVKGSLIQESSTS